MDVLIITHNIHPSQSSITTAACVRVVVMAIAAYEYASHSTMATLYGDSCSTSYLLTLPLEYRIYRGSKRIR